LRLFGRKYQRMPSIDGEFLANRFVFESVRAATAGWLAIVPNGKQNSMPRIRAASPAEASRQIESDLPVASLNYIGPERLRTFSSSELP
jgi:hypothetical protein